MNRTQGYGKNTVRINESQLRDMIAESVKKVLNENKMEDNEMQFSDFARELFNIAGNTMKMIRAYREAAENDDYLDNCMATYEKEIGLLYHALQTIWDIPAMQYYGLGPIKDARTTSYSADWYKDDED